MKHIFIAGHGRAEPASVQSHTVPPNVTMYWATALGHNSSGSLANPTAGFSGRLLSGGSNSWSDTVTNGATLSEHWLCPDLTLVIQSKAATFASRRISTFEKNNYYFLHPKGNHSVKLTRLIDFLKGKFPGEEIHLYWTCCRSIIGQVSRYTATPDGLRGNSHSEATAAPGREKNPSIKVTGEVTDTHVDLVCYNQITSHQWRGVNLQESTSSVTSTRRTSIDFKSNRKTGRARAGSYS